MYLTMYSEGYKHFTAVKLDSTVKQDTVVMGTLINFGLEELTVYPVLYSEGCKHITDVKLNSTVMF